MERSPSAVASLISATGPQMQPYRGSSGISSPEVVEDALDVFVLFQRVDQLQHLGRFVVGERHQVLRDVFGFGGLDGDAARLDGRLQLAEVGEGAADDGLGLALVV